MSLLFLWRTSSSEDKLDIEKSWKVIYYMLRGKSNIVYVSLIQKKKS